MTYQGNTAAIPAGDAPKTSTVWFSCETQPPPDWHAIFVLGSTITASSKSLFAAVLGNGEVLLWDGFMIGCDPPTPIYPCDGAWHHFAASYASPTITLYYDGKAVCSRGVGPLALPSSPAVYLAWTGDTDLLDGEPWTGALARARVYATALSAAQVSADMGSCAASPSASPSAAPSLPPGASPSATPPSPSPASPPWAALGLGIGIPLGLLVLGCAALGIVSALTGVPVTTVACRAISGCCGACSSGGATGKLTGPLTTAASAARVRQLAASAGEVVAGCFRG